MPVTVSTNLKLGILSFVVGMLLHIVSFISPYWMSNPGMDLGLWFGCTHLSGLTACFAIQNATDVFHLVQAAETIALIFGIFSILAIIVLVSKPTVYKTHVCLSLTVSTGVITVVGVIIFLAEMHGSFGWAAYLEFPAGIAVTGAGLFIHVDSRTNTSYQPIA